jgi:hypothetical protein
MVPILPNEWVTLLQAAPPWLAAAGLIVLAGLSWLAGVLRKRRRTRRLLAAIEASVRGKVVLFRRPLTGGFTGHIVPAPDPFREFSVSYRVLSILDPVDLVRRLAGRPGSRLQLRAVLATPPAGEIIWRRGEPPNRALGSRPGSTLWVHRRLDISGAEYATRGSNTNALCHAFLDLHARFGPLLLQLIIQRAGAPQVELVVAAGQLELREVAPLLATLRLAGRAALLA